jgi:hypothetical protein
MSSAVDGLGIGDASNCGRAVVACRVAGSAGEPAVPMPEVAGGGWPVGRTAGTNAGHCAGLEVVEVPPWLTYRERAPPRGRQDRPG